MKVVIADDDKLIRKGLRIILKESNPDIEIVGEAFSGKQALEMVLDKKPELLVTDIKMPVMDGVELVKAINASEIKTRCIVLSGFDEYSYVRETMKYGAVDYLLKPVREDVLKELLNKISSDIQQERQRERQFSLLNATVEESKAAIKEKFLTELIRGTISDTSQCAHLIEESGILRPQNRIIAVIELDDSYKVKAELSQKSGASILSSLGHYVLEILAGGKYSNSLITEIDNRFIVLFSSEFSDITFDSEIEDILKQIARWDKLAENGLTITCGISNPYAELEKTHISYYQAVFALKSRFYKGKGKVYFYSREEYVYDKFDFNIIEDHMKALLNQIEIGEALKAKDTICEIIDIIKKSRVEQEQFKAIVAEIIQNVCFTSQEFKSIADDYTYKDNDLLQAVMEMNTVLELEEYISTAFYNIISRMNQVRAERSKKIIEISKEYIKKHYKEDISQKMVAEYVHLNPNYFSELFKKETGKSFTDYTVEVRINAARKLLAKHDVKVYEAGQMVGYDEPVSFNRAFKRVVGVSPSEYKKILK